MKKASSFISFLLIGLLVSTPVSASDTDSFISDLFDTSSATKNIEYDSQGRITNTDPKVENTYKIPEISAGFNYDLEANRMRGTMTFEVKDSIYIFNEDYPLKIDAGVAEDLVLITTNMRFTSILEVSAGISYGYDFKEEEFTPGINFLITKF